MLSELPSDPPRGRCATPRFAIAHGTVVLTGGSPGAHTGLTYQPDPNYCNDPGAAPEDTFTYTLTGGSQATVSMTVTCVNDAPQADDETFNGANGAIGNTSLVVDDPSDGAPSANGPHKKVIGDILDGDTDVDGPGPLTVTPGTFATNDGGSVTIEADGDFVYLGDPADGCADASDFFDYTLEDSGSPEQTDTGRVNVSIAGCVWYVNNDAAGNSGTSTAPFDTLAQAEAASGANHTVFVYDGNNTTTGYAAGFAMNAGERLIGEHEGLVVDPDGGGALGPETLLVPSPGARPTLTDTNADVVELDDGNEVRGFNLDPQGAGGGIAGGAGDTGGGTIDDVNVVDDGTVGSQPGLELDGTTGAFNVSDLTVDNDAIGVRLNNAGSVNFASTGTISITSAGAKGLDAANTNMGSGSVFDAVKVTGSDSGGVSMLNTTGTTTFGDGSGTDLDLTTSYGRTPAFGVSNGGTISVPSGGTANVSATGGPAVDVAGTSGASLPFDDVDSTNSPNDGINLDGLGVGTFSASSGDIAGAAGIAFDLNGGSGAVTYPGRLDNGAGATAEISGRSGGAVSLSGEIADTSDVGGGISLASNTGGSTTFSNASKVLNTGASNAVGMSSSDGHTLSLTGGGLDIDTTSGTGLSAATSGTLAVSGSGNTIDTATGRALNVTDTDVGGTPLTLQRISSNGASSGILLSNTGTNDALTVSSTGSGTCTNVDQTGCSGGRIRNTVGADDSGATPSGTGIVLNKTRGVSLTRMHMHDHQNYGIRGSSVVGFTLADSVIDGTNGTNSSTPFNEGSVRFSELTGTVSVTKTPISGARADNFLIDNTTGTLNSTFSSVNIGPNSASDGNDGIQVEGTGSATVNVAVQNSTFTSSRGDLFQWIGDGTGGGALTFTGNTLSNNHSGIATGGGGVTVSGGGPGNATMNISNNTSRDSHGAAFTILKSPPFANGPCPAVPTSLTTTVNNNTIGVAGVANSGSLEGSGIVIQQAGCGTFTAAVTNNEIRQYNNFGISAQAGAGIAYSGNVNYTITGNTVANPGNNQSIGSPFQGIALNNGVTPGDNYQTCWNVKANSANGAGRNGGHDFRTRSRMAGNVRLPGFVGNVNDDAALAGFIANQNDANANDPAANPPVPTSSVLAASTFSGGSACTLP